jgi:hypothetical protein
MAMIAAVPEADDNGVMNANTGPHVDRSALLAIALLLVGLGCSTLLPAVDNEPTASLPTATYALATPYADSPAAGICSSGESDDVEMTLLPGIPDPRCLEIRPDQHLLIRNMTGGAVDFRLGRFSGHLEDGERIRIEAAFGTYLAPGVHALEIDPCCGGELVLPPG